MQIEVPCNLNLALCYIEIGVYQNAIKHCDTVLNIDPK